jgi:plastocyanin
MVKLIALLCSCLAISLVAGCGGDDDDEEGGGGQAQEEPSGGGKAVAVSMMNITFLPGSVTVPKGGTVRWTNDESLGHDVTKTAGPGPDFKSGPPGAMQRDDTFEQTFDTPGKIEYVCTVHKDMTGTITVK